ncbi:MAG: ComF family protein [Campylobacterota bacterium]|nr:ComF family protein [Campylobacterota bacterium]
MRCFSCYRFSRKSLCPRCRDQLFAPTIKERQVGSLKVISFYRYSTIESLLLHKHKPEGYRIFRDLSEMTMQPFIRRFIQEDPSPISIIGIDERIKNGYSHVACMTHKMKSDSTQILHASLLSQNSVNYAGKTLQYRLNNPRDFSYTGPGGIDVILVDDIITTGITLQEAQMTLKRHSVNVLFALTLADAQE